MDVCATRYATRLAVTYCLLLTTVQAGNAADCEAILGQFNLAIDEGREQDAQGLVDGSRPVRIAGVSRSPPSGGWRRIA